MNGMLMEKTWDKVGSGLDTLVDGFQFTQHEARFLCHE